MGYGGFVRSVDLGKDYMLHSELYESVRVTDVKCGEGIQWRDCSYEVRTCHAPGAAVSQLFKQEISKQEIFYFVPF